MSCGTCKYYKPNGAPSEMGNCTYQVKFPDSIFARCEGTKKTMNQKDGLYCRCYEEKSDQELFTKVNDKTCHWRYE